MGTRQNCLNEAVLTSTHNLCFEQKYEKYQNFLSENLHFLVLKFSVYLNRRVFVINVKIIFYEAVLCLLNQLFHDRFVEQIICQYSF